MNPKTQKMMDEIEKMPLSELYVIERHIKLMIAVGEEMTKCECEIPTMEEAIFRECEGWLELYDMKVINGHVVNNKGEVMK